MLRRLTLSFLLSLLHLAIWWWQFAKFSNGYGLSRLLPEWGGWVLGTALVFSYLWFLAKIWLGNDDAPD